MAEKRKDKDGRILPDNVIQRKDDTYMWKKMIDGKQYCEYANTLGEIKQKRNKALYEIEQGTYKNKKEKKQAAEEKAQHDITLNEWFFQWRDAYRLDKVKFSTLQTDHVAYMKYVFNSIGKKKINDIRQLDVVILHKDVYSRKISYSRILKINGILTSMFNAAIANGIIETNPAVGAVQVPKPEKPPERRVLTMDEQNIFLNFVKNDEHFKIYYPIFAIGFGTGLRIGELLGLTWKDIDLDKNVIRVDHTLMATSNYIKGGKKEYHINSPKTKTSIREVPMLCGVKECFLCLKENGRKSDYSIGNYTDFIFLTQNGTPYFQENIRKAIERIIKHINSVEEANARKEDREPVVFKNFAPHAMRHSFATRCYELGVKEKVTQKILGHSTLQMTMNVYTHITDDVLAKEIENINGLI